MGYYVECEQPKGKVEQILAQEPSAREGGPPITFPGKDQALLCVLDNGSFEAAGFCFDEDEWRHEKMLPK